MSSTTPQPDPLRTRLLRGGAMVLLGALASACGGVPGRSPAVRPGGAAGDGFVTELATILRAEDRREVDEGLTDLAAHDDAVVRTWAVRALGRIGDPAGRGREVLTRALGDETPAVRAQAVLSLAMIDRAVPLEAAADEAPEVRRAVADAVAWFPSATAEQAIAGLLADDDPAVAGAACRAVPKLPAVEFAVAPMLALARAPDRPDTLVSCTHALARLIETHARLGLSARREVRAWMLQLARAPVPELRRLAAIGLTIPASDEEAVAAGALVEDPDAGVRIAAIDALSFPGAPLEPFLSEVPGDENAAVELALIDGLSQMRGDDVIERLVDYVVFDERPWVKVRALRALPGTRAETQVLAGGLSRDERDYIRRETATLLRGRVDDHSIEYVRLLHSDPEPAVRAAIIPVVAEIDAPLRELLAEDLGSDDPAIREALARAAGVRLAPDDAAPDRVDEALGLLAELWGTGEGPDAALAVEIVDAAASGGSDPRVRSLLDSALRSSSYRVRRTARGHLTRLWGEDAAADPGPAADLPLEHYEEIVRWARKPRAAIVTVEREGFLPARFTVRLEPEDAPLAAWRFADLAHRGAFDGVVIEDFVPDRYVAVEGTGPRGGSARRELSPHPFWAGSVGFANAGPESSDRRWFVTLSFQPQLSGVNTRFGSIARSLDGVVELLLPDDRIVSVVVYEGDGTEPLPPLEVPEADATSAP